MQDSERLYEGVYGPYRCAGPLKIELKFVRELPGACTYAQDGKRPPMRCLHLCHLNQVTRDGLITLWLITFNLLSILALGLWIGTL